MTWRPSKFWLLLPALMIIAAVVLVLLPFRVCTDRAFVDETTGSRKGERQWFFGVRSGKWYEKSALEKFVRTNQPGRINQRWTSYAGTGRNVFGRAISFEHGRPGAVLLLRPEDIAAYCARASDADKRRLYNTLSSGDQARITEAATQILLAVHTEKPTSPPRKR